MHLSIGHRLAGARRAQGLSILDVSHKTRISPGNIRNIESGEYQNCPSLVYAKGFLKLLNQFLGAHLDDEIKTFDTGAVVTSPDVLIVVPDDRHPRQQSVPVFSGETRPAFIGLMVGILLVVTLPVAAIKLHKKLNPETAQATESIPAESSRKPVVENEVNQSPTLLPASSKPHIPDSAPPELAAIQRLEGNVELDELSPPALAASQPIPEVYSAPATSHSSSPSKTTYPSAPRQANRLASAETRPVAAPRQPSPPKKKSFFSRLFGENSR